MKKILISGAAGFLGSALAHKLLVGNKYFIVQVDNLLTGKIGNLAKGENCLFIKCDVNKYKEIAAVMNKFNFDYVFHYAAVVGVNRTLQFPKMVMDDIYGLQHIFELSKSTGVKRVIYTSSSEVYGEPVHLPLQETGTPLNSKLPYAVIKNIGECFCKTYKQEYGIDYNILRLFNTYGPGQSTDFVVSRFIDQALKGEPVTIYGDGSQTRTFCYIDDHTDFITRILEDNLLLNDIVNVGNDRLVSIKELAETVIELSGSSSVIEYLPPLKTGDITRRQPDITKMRQYFDRELTDLREGIGKILEFGKRQNLREANRLQMINQWEMVADFY
jgi:UDP-glucose 4-epimerase